MRKQVLNIFTVVALCSALVSCKKTKEAETGMAVAAAKTESISKKYIVDVEQSRINWIGSKPTGTHSGTIELVSGVLEMENDTLKAGTFLIKMKSITCNDLEGEMKTNLEAHLKGTVEGKEGDFFNIEKYPTGAFDITGVESIGEGAKKLSGNLGLLDKKHNITFPIKFNSEGEGIVMTSEIFTIDRTKWGINYGSKSIFDNLGDKFISDNIQLSISIVAKAN